MKPSAAMVALVALAHAAFFVLESFLYKTPFGLKLFKQTPESAAHSAVFALNQGVYNAFLAAGLVWGLTAAQPQARSIQTFFLGCALIAGLVGGATASRTIYLVQALPALLALLLLRAGR